MHRLAAKLLVASLYYDIFEIISKFCCCFSLFLALIESIRPGIRTATTNSAPVVIIITLAEIFSKRNDVHKAQANKLWPIPEGFAKRLFLPEEVLDRMRDEDREIEVMNAMQQGQKQIVTPQEVNSGTLV